MASETVNYADLEFPSETEVDLQPFFQQLHYSPKHFLDDKNQEKQEYGLSNLVFLTTNYKFIKVTEKMMGGHDSLIQNLIGEEGSADGMFIGVQFYPKFQIKVTSRLLDQIIRTIKPLPEFVLQLLPNDLDPSRSLTAQFTGIDNTTQGYEPEDLLETAGAIFHCQRRLLKVNGLRKPSWTVQTATFYTQARFVRAEQFLSAFSMIIAGSDIERLIHLYLGMKKVYESKHIEKHDPPEALRMRYYHSLIARLAKEGWQEYLGDFEYQLNMVEDIAQLQQMQKGQDNGPTAGVASTDPYELIELSLHLGLNIHSAKAKITANIEVLHDTQRFYREKISLRTGFEEIDEAIRLLDRYKARAQHLGEQAEKMAHKSSTLLAVDRGSRMEVLGWNGLKLSYSHQSISRGAATMIVLYMPAIFTATLFSTYFFPQRGDRFYTVGFGYYLAVTIPLSLFCLLTVWFLGYSRRFSDALKRHSFRRRRRDIV